MIRNLSKLVVLLLVHQSQAWAQCEVEWTSAFSAPFSFWTNAIGRDLTSFDDGEGAQLYFSGWFGTRISVEDDTPNPIHGLGVFDGERFRIIDDPELEGLSTGLTVHDFGAGPELAVLLHSSTSQVLNDWIPHVATYSGGAATPLPGTFTMHPGALQIPLLHAIVSFDAGNGPELYVAGDFRRVGGQVTSNIARFDGTQWRPVGAGLNNEVLTLHVHDFGNGPRLVAGGRFTQSGSTAARRVAVFNGTQWTSVGTSPPNGIVNALTTWNDGLEDVLVAGGRFSAADGQNASGIAAFAGGTWSPMGPGIDLSQQFSHSNGVEALRTETSPEGKLLIGVKTETSAGASTNVVLSWDGSTLRGHSEGIESLTYDAEVGIEALGSFDFGNGPEDIAWGQFNLDGGSRACLARRTGGAWEPFVANGAPHPIVGVGTSWDDGAEDRLYCAFRFSASTIMSSFPGQPWTPVGGDLHWASAIEPYVSDLLAFNGSLRGSTGDDSGVYALGLFTHAGAPSPNGLPVSNIARFDGTQWHPLGLGVSVSDNLNNYRSGLAIFDDGSGPRLFLIGNHFQVGGQSATGFAAWDGVNWERIPINGLDQFAPNEMCVFDDGSGEKLYFSGSFVASHGGFEPLVRWNGNEFGAVPIPSGLVDSSVEFGGPLAAFNDGTGNKLWLGGSDLNLPHNENLASWDGNLWTAHSTPVTRIRSLLALDDGQGPAQLLMGGAVYEPSSDYGGVAVFGDPQIDFFNEVVNFLFEGPSAAGGARSAYATGLFENQGALTMSGFAERRRGSCDVGDSYCFGDGGASATCTPCLCGNDAAPGSGGGCVNAGGMGSKLTATGAPSLSNDSLRFTLSDMPGASFGTLFSGANRLPANPANPCFGLDSGISNLGDGLRCMGGLGLRHGTLPSDTNGGIGETNAGWGLPDGPVTGFIANAGFAAGQKRHFQVLHRDGMTSGCGTGLNSSQGLTILFAP